MKKFLTLAAVLLLSFSLFVVMADGSSASVKGARLGANNHASKTVIVGLRQYWQKVIGARLLRKSGQTSEVKPAASASIYPWHANIVATEFWVGEAAGPENGYISNDDSAWDEMWVERFGGVDDPSQRAGYYPKGFIPKENPFYAAVPYSDFDEIGRKESAKQIPWYDYKMAEQQNYSFVKNRWIEVRNQAGSSAYAQVEDAGPHGSDDFAYVFGNALPKHPAAGLDLSPAVQDYLGLTGLDKVSWRFVSAEEVPTGPWKQIVTVSDCYWK